ncbi:MAG TPA: hypothetical protein VEH28_01470 [Thermoplasmata archaeon]|nr:hypothetical protein [Thermoplasmata archaeon]
MASPKDAAAVGRDRPLEPDEEAALLVQVDRADAEKRRALSEPGASWHDWFYYSAAKWWILLAFFIVDTWVVVGWLETGVAIAAVPSLIAAVYLEALAYQVLWHRPMESPREFRRSVFRLVYCGRWTPEAERLRRGEAAGFPEEGPSPEEFL